MVFSFSHHCLSAQYLSKSTVGIAYRHLDRETLHEISPIVVSLGGYSFSVSFLNFCETNKHS